MAFEWLNPVDDLKKAAGFVVDVAKKGWDALGDAFAGAADALGGAVGDAVDAASSVVSAVEHAPAAVTSDLLDVASTVGTALADVANATGDVIADAYGTFKHTVSDGLSKLQDISDKLSLIDSIITFNPLLYPIDRIAVDALVSYVNYNVDLYGRIYNAATDLSWDKLTHNPLGELRQVASDALDVLGATDTFNFLYTSLNDINPFDGKRSLTDDERSAAEQVFGSSIDLGAVRVIQHDIVKGALDGFKNEDNAFTTFHTIHMWDSDPTISLITHELVHVWQYEHKGADYIPSALFDAQHGEMGYDYGGPAGLQAAMDSGQSLVPPPSDSPDSPHFDNFESMADVVEHYAMLRLNLGGAVKTDQKNASLYDIEVNSRRGSKSPDVDSVHYVIHSYDLPMYAQFVSEVSSIPLEQLSPSVIYAANSTDDEYPRAQPEKVEVLNGKMVKYPSQDGIERIYGNRLDNEIHAGRGGLEIIKGEGGTDTVVFPDPVGQYTIARQPDGHYKVTYHDSMLPGSDARDQGVYDLYDIALVQFAASSPTPIGNLADNGQTGIGKVATPISVGSDIYPTVTSPGDVNRFSALLTAGATYWFSTEGSSTGRGAFPDSYLRLLDTDGLTQLASDRGSGIGSNSFVSFTPAKTGTYYIVAGSSGTGTGSYLLSERAADDYPSNPATAGTLTPGSSKVGTYDFVADTDWFRAALSAGTTYRFVMDSTPTGPGTQIQPRLKLYGVGGTTQIAADNNNRGGSEASITFTPTTTDTYYVSAESFGSNVGTYRLSEAVISGATPSAAPASRMSFMAGSDDASPTAAASSGTAMTAFQPVGEVATGMLVHPSVGTVPPDQLIASAGSVIQPQYTAGDGTQQPAASLIMGLSGYTTSDVQVTPYLSTP